MTAPFLIPVTCLGVVFCSSVLWGDPQDSAKGPQKFVAIPPKEQLITAPSEKTWILLWGSAGKQNVRRWAMWPKEESLKTLATCHNRAETTSFESNPQHVGTKSPEGAAIDARIWVEHVIKEEYLPKDLVNRILAVQEISPEDSLMVCRWTVDGTSIQVIQSVARIGVVIRPKQEWRDATNDDDELSLFLIDKLLKHGSEIVSWGAKPLEGFPAELKLFTSKQSAPYPASDNWWGHPVWYIDGKAMAIFFNKQESNRPHNPSPKEPWF